MPMPPTQVPAHTPTGQPGTVLLPGSEGVVSMARQSGSVRTTKKKKKKQQNAAAFWVICIVAGILIGIIAYVIVSSAMA